MSWQSPAARVLAVGAACKVALVPVPADGGGTQQHISLTSPPAGERVGAAAGAIAWLPPALLGACGLALRC